MSFFRTADWNRLFVKTELVEDEDYWSGSATWMLTEVKPVEPALDAVAVHFNTASRRP